MQMKYIINKGSDREDYPEVTVESKEMTLTSSDFVCFLTKAGNIKFAMSKSHIITISTTH